MAFKQLRPRGGYAMLRNNRRECTGGPYYCEQYGGTDMGVGESQKSLTPAEIGIICACIVTFVLIVACVFYCRHANLRRNREKDQGVQTAQIGHDTTLNQGDGSEQVATANQMEMTSQKSHSRHSGQDSSQDSSKSVGNRVEHSLRINTRSDTAGRVDADRLDSPLPPLPSAYPDSHGRTTHTNE